MTLRWILITVFLVILTAVTVWDIAAYTLATSEETISNRLNRLAHTYPEIPFVSGIGISFCSLLPLLPSRRRWIAVFFMFMLVMAAVGAHCFWPVYGM